MAGGTRFHRWIQAASLGRDEGKSKGPGKNQPKRAVRSPQTRGVSGDARNAPGARRKNLHDSEKIPLARSEGRHNHPSPRFFIILLGMASWGRGGGCGEFVFDVLLQGGFVAAD